MASRPSPFTGSSPPLADLKRRHDGGPIPRAPLALGRRPAARDGRRPAGATVPMEVGPHQPDPGPRRHVSLFLSVLGLPRASLAVWPAATVGPVALHGRA